MSEADQYPDPDLSFLEGTTGEDIAAVGRGLEDAAQQLDRQTQEIAAGAQTTTVDRVLDALVAIKKGLEAAAAAADTAASVFRNMQAAWEAWKGNAPRQEAIAFAERSVADARQRLMDADDRHAALFRRQLREAEAKLTELIEKRKAADAELAAALERAQAMLIPIPGMPDPRVIVPPGPAAAAPGPAAPGPTVAVPGPAAAAPPAGLPGTALPGATPPPGTGLSAMPETAGAATASGLSPAQAGALAAALSQQQQSQPPVQIPQPMAPAMAAPQQQKPAENPFGGAGEPIDLAALLGPAAMGALAGVGAPALSSTTASPALTPLTPAGPTFTPLNPTGLGGATPANPVVQPVVTGTSTAGLTTDSNVSGRSDGTAARTDQTAATRPGGMGAGTGMGAPMMPMMPMGMGGNGGAGKDRDPVTANQSSDGYLLSGAAAIGEAIPGGTIARKEE